MVPQHPVPRAKFPVIDIHSHQPTPISPAEFDRVMKGMQDNNLQILVNLSGGSGDRLRSGIEALKTSKYKDRMVLFANVNWNNVGPGFGPKAAAQLEADFNAGAIGLKVFKDLGMFARKADGSRLKVDDPELDPVWEMCAKHNAPVLIHIAEPQAFFDPLDFNNERWLELALYADRRHQTGVRFEELMTERNNMIKNHPKTNFILAHFGWHGNDLARAGKLLDQNPNVYYDVAAVLYDFGRQPRAAHEFFIKLPGSDPVRQRQLSARRISVLLAGFRDQRRILRLLPRLPRVLETVWNRLARSGIAEALLSERAEAGAGPVEGGVYGLGFAIDLNTMATYLVTGGAGFIGSHLTEELIRRGHQVRVSIV